MKWSFLDLSSELRSQLSHMKNKYPSKICILATTTFLTLSGKFIASAADFPTTMTGLNPAAWWRFNETAASPAPNIASNWSTLGTSVNGYVLPVATNRSEERRVGKECRSRWSPYH